MRRRLKSKRSKNSAKTYHISSDKCRDLVAVMQACCEDSSAWLSCMLGKERISAQTQIDCIYFYFRCEGADDAQAMDIVHRVMPFPIKSKLIHMKKQLHKFELAVNPYRQQVYRVSPGFHAWVNRPI